MSVSASLSLPDFAAEGGLHEIYAATHADAACLSGCGLMLAQARTRGACLWVRHAGQDREVGTPYPAGLMELGIHPAAAVVVLSRDPACLLQAALEGARCAALGAVIVELWGEAKAYDLTATRRLALAARASGVLVVVARAAAMPTPSAAQTRWRMRAMPSRALVAHAPGAPAFEMTLLRARNGQEGLSYCVEWDRDARQFIPRSLPGSGSNTGNDTGRAASLSGAVVPLPADRQDMPGPWRQAG